jgi:hypothetical protein
LSGFPPPGLRVRCRLAEATVAGSHGNGQKAPRAATRGPGQAFAWLIAERLGVPMAAEIGSCTTVFQASDNPAREGDLS